MKHNIMSTEEKIFDAAAQVFEEKGLEGARMQEIADNAGINKALLHYYFRSKDKLFNAVFDKLAGTMFSKLFGCFEKDVPLLEKLELFYKEHISFLQEHPRMPSFILNEINKHPERVIRVFNMERIQVLRENLFREFDEEIKAGRMKDTDKMQLLINIVGLSVFPFAARGLVEFLLEQQNIKFDDFIEKRKTELPLLIMKAVSPQ